MSERLAALTDSIREQLFTEAAWTGSRPGVRAPRARRRVIGFLSALGLLPAVRRLWMALATRLEPDAVALAREEHENLRRVIAFSVSSGTNCIDIGAHEGSVLALLTELAPDGEHIAWEPLPEMADELRRRFPGVAVRDAALSNEPGEAEFAHVVSRPAFSGFRARAGSEGHETSMLRVGVETLDASLPAGYSPGLIKIDVEGAELQVLQGALRTLRAARPVIIFEHEADSSAPYGTSPCDIWDLLCDEAGMRIFDLAGKGPYGRSEFERSVVEGRRINYVAMP